MVQRERKAVAACTACTFRRQLPFLHIDWGNDNESEMFIVVFKGAFRHVVMLTVTEYERDANANKPIGFQLL